MKKACFHILVTILICPLMLQGQTATEAFRVSQSDPFGTARNLGVGNSMFAIGPDISAIGLNPSGLGGYRKSEFVFTTAFTASKYSSSFDTDRDETIDNYSNLRLSNIGFIIHNRPRSGFWNSSNWAIGLNRVADYYKELNYSGNTLGSITDSWRENATGLDSSELNGFEEALAWNTGAIYDFERDNIYETDYSLNDHYELYKQESYTLEGGKSEFFLAYGADFNQKIMIGFSLGLPIVNYTEIRNYSEIDGGDDGVPFFNDLEYFSYINSTGYGLNAKLSVTLKPTKFINLALALHSPTRLSMTDNFNTTLSYDFTIENDNYPLYAESPIGSFDYALRTPWSASGGIGVIAGKSGFLAAHAKWTDYASMKYDYSVRGNGNRYQSIENEVNNDIRTNYGSALQFNMGGELVINALRVRGGVSMIQSAFNNDNSFDPSFHGGLGYRDDHFYVDLGYKLTMQDDGYLPYETIDATQPLVVSDYTHHQIAATIGLKF